MPNDTVVLKGTSKRHLGGAGLNGDCSWVVLPSTMVSPVRGFCSPSRQEPLFQSQPSTPDIFSEEPDDHNLLMECLALLLADNAENAEIFRRAGGARAVHNMVALTAHRWQALRVAQQLILGDDSSKAHDDLGTLLELVQSTPPHAYGVKIDILRTVIRLFSLDPHIKLLFRQVCSKDVETVQKGGERTAEIGCFMKAQKASFSFIHTIRSYCSPLSLIILYSLIPTMLFPFCQPLCSPRTPLRFKALFTLFTRLSR